MLHNPGKSIPTTDLWYAQTQFGVDFDSSLRRNRENLDLGSIDAADDDEREASARMRLMSPDAGEIMDDVAEQNYRRRCAELEQKLASAKRESDKPQEDKTRREIAALVKAFNEGRVPGPGGRKKKMSPAGEKAVKAVSRAIQRALDDLQEAHRPLWQHLNCALTIGSICSYHPDPPIEWEF